GAAVWGSLERAHRPLARDACLRRGVRPKLHAAPRALATAMAARFRGSAPDDVIVGHGDRAMDRCAVRSLARYGGRSEAVLGAEAPRMGAGAVWRAGTSSRHARVDCGPLEHVSALSRRDHPGTAEALSGEQTRGGARL